MHGLCFLAGTKLVEGSDGRVSGILLRQRTALQQIIDLHRLSGGTIHRRLATVVVMLFGGRPAGRKKGRDA